MRVGIDLGTTNTVVSYIDENGIWNKLSFSNGSSEDRYFLPSRVAVKDGMVIVGRPAAEMLFTSPADVVCDAKANMPEPDKEYYIGGLTMTAEEISAHILKEVYSELERQFPEERTFNAFVTVPTGFMTEARLATKQALRDAGFETDENCLTDEPIAAAVAYGTRLDGDKLVLVVDIGGGTFDLSLMKTSIVGASTGAGRLEPVGHGRDMHLGGNDVDDILVKAMSDSFVRAGGIPLDHPQGTQFRDMQIASAGQRLRSLTIDIKKQLYSAPDRSAYAYIRDLYGKADLDFTISPDEYMSLMADINKRYERCLGNIFVGTGYSPKDVDHVIVVGGMAHEICLRRILMRMFGENRLIVPEDAMYLVSKGAAICNSDLKLAVENRAYTSIGLLKDNGRAVENIIKEGCTVKTGEIFTAELSPAEPDATAVRIQIVEYTGEFSPERYTVILSGDIPIAERGFTLFKRPVRLMLEAAFSEDKILDLTVKQKGRTDRLDVRLGGNK